MYMSAYEHFSGGWGATGKDLFFIMWRKEILQNLRYIPCPLECEERNQNSEDPESGQRQGGGNKHVAGM